MQTLEVGCKTMNQITLHLRLDPSQKHWPEKDTPTETRPICIDCGMPLIVMKLFQR